MNAEVHCFPEYHRAINGDKRRKVICEKHSGLTKCLVTASRVMAAHHSSIFTHRPSTISPLTALLGLPSFSAQACCPATLQQRRNAFPGDPSHQVTVERSWVRPSGFSTLQRKDGPTSVLAEPTARNLRSQAFLPLQSGVVIPIFAHEKTGLS